MLRARSGAVLFSRLLQHQGSAAGLLSCACNNAYTYALVLGLTFDRVNRSSSHGDGGPAPVVSSGRHSTVPKHVREHISPGTNFASVCGHRPHCQAWRSSTAATSFDLCTWLPRAWHRIQRGGPGALQPGSWPQKSTNSSSSLSSQRMERCGVASRARVQRRTAWQAH